MNFSKTSLSKGPSFLHVMPGFAWKAEAVDTLLCASWVRVSVMPAVGVDQTKEMFWQKILAEIVAGWDSMVPSNQNQIQPTQEQASNRFSVIQREANRYSACFKGALRNTIERSGEGKDSFDARIKAEADGRYEQVRQKENDAIIARGKPPKRQGLDYQYPLQQGLVDCCSFQSKD